MRDGPGLSDLERLFRGGEISRNEFARSLLALGLTTSGLELLLGSKPLPVEAQTPPARYLVLMVLDAFRPEYIRMGHMPNLEGLMKRGTTFNRAWVGQMESETPPGHATIATGSFPRNDGIIGFEWRDPAVPTIEIQDGWGKGVVSGAMERDMQASGASSISLAVKAADPSAVSISLSSEKVYAAGAMGSLGADYILYEARTGHQSLVPAAVTGYQPDSAFFQHPHLNFAMPPRHFTDWDWLSGMLAMAAIDAFHPRVLMINFPGGDVYGHPYGGPASPKIMGTVATGIDKNIGRVIRAYKRAGIYNQTIFAVTADHGMVPNAHTVPVNIVKAAVRAGGGDYFWHTGGTAADIYINNPTAAPKVATSVAALPNVTTAYFQTSSAGSYGYELASGVSIDPDLDLANRYILGSFAGPTAPDVVALFRENTIGHQNQNLHGDHGGANWGAQHIPLVIAGPGVRSTASQFPARLIDIAPTLLRLLGVPVPKMDGVVLADAVASATAQDVATQNTLRASLTRLQSALITQSLDDIAQDNAQGVRLPPQAKPQP
ncbi:MAG TPA: alkaline phosphatase family protein [Chloroflexota bacterium]|nr:alkaline phosphatase family protein [Chloroflexota bacterium]